MTNKLEKPLLSCTIAEFIEAMKTGMGVSDIDDTDDTVLNDNKTADLHLCTGIKSLAKLLNCHYNTAQKLYASGILDPAVYRHGKLIIFNQDLVLDILKVHKRKGGVYKFNRKKNE